MTDDDSVADIGSGVAGEVRLRNREELVAAVPHVLGFHPRDSLVVMSVGGSGPTLRIDHPHDREAIAEVVHIATDPFRRHGYGRGGIAVVHFTDDHERAAALTGQLVAAYVDMGVTPLIAVRADSDRIVDLASGWEGPLPEETRTRIAAEWAYAGKPQPRADRSALAASLQVVPTRQDRILRHVGAAVRRFETLESAGALANERRWMSEAISGFEATTVPIKDVDATRMLVALCHPKLRDVASAALTRDNSRAHVALWTDLARRAPEPVRDHPLALVALSAWVSGNGALAWTAIEAGNEQHGLARVTARILKSGLPPAAWEAVRSQYFAENTDSAGAHARSAAGRVRPALWAPDPPATGTGPRPSGSHDRPPPAGPSI
ncbi:DUF4192 domain-containing protein [Nocardioides zeae]|uniref:DUF4192 domain-containing protein n=1 Tax=Nocardioides imazamoxiresistens TaxID=3231893 RepID=A0ABU3Q1F3_9ACTN|nr:DUF4192 domain-containing protein [Nocardioides zeae]MDT9594867.1 DUF4192 domain-containing protein [Nocardioides zeae]